MGEWIENGCGSELLSVDEMYRADAAAMAGGIKGETLMGAAGAAVVDHIRNRWARRPVAVLCGPGNNGGDGFVVARLLSRDGWPVTLSLLGDGDRLKGDAALNAERWEGPVKALGDDALEGAELVVDALFGAGLTGPPDGTAATVIEDINRTQIPCVAVDIPSGVHGDDGRVEGVAPRCRSTVTFFRRKPGHLLLPGRELAGEVTVADIGIPDHVLGNIGPTRFANGPVLWMDTYPWPRSGDHKYNRGHVVIAGGAEMTGAARLAARGAMRVGAGIATVASPPQAVQIYATAMAGVLVSAVADGAQFASLLEDRRKNAVLVGPGGGINPTTRDMALAALAGDRAVVLDADALTVFGDDRDALFAETRGKNCLLTPHEGEYARLFQHTGDKLARARAAAVQCGAAVLLKGADTVVAAADGRCVVNHNGPATLATAGAGDVLAGLALGLMAQGMDAFRAGCASAWLHGEAAAAFGPGLVAEDLPETLPGVLRKLRGATAPP